MDSLDGARVLITGASSGIGLAAARRFTAAGARVALLARSEAVERAGWELGAVAVRADITQRESLGPAIEEAVSELGGLDVAVVNAGGAAYGRFDETPAEDFDRAIGLTLLGAVNTVRCVLPHLERTDGTLVVLSSVASRVPLPLQSAYVAAKHGLRGFVRSLRTELKGSGSAIRVAEIEPGPVDTPFWNHGTSATGRLAPRYPGSYTAGTVADAVVAAAVRPRRRVTVGWSMGVAVGGLYALLPGPVERLMGWAGNVAHPRGPSAEGRGVLYEPTGDLETGGGLPLSRPSLRVALMRALG